MSESPRVAMIRDTLTEAFQPSRLEIVDDSHLHAGHASAGGAGHFTVTITAAAFSGKNAVQRHRLIFAAMDKLMNTEVHALSIHALSPEEDS